LAGQTGDEAEDRQADERKRSPHKERKTQGQENLDQKPGHPGEGKREGLREENP